MSILQQIERRTEQEVKASSCGSHLNAASRFHPKLAYVRGANALAYSKLGGGPWQIKFATISAENPFTGVPSWMRLLARRTRGGVKPAKSARSIKVRRSKI
jgi:hypothetical protein